MQNITRSLTLLRIEAVLTATFLAMPIMVPFYNSIGMDQGQIGLSQAIFTVALLMVNIPTGWFADKFSRKFSNAFGDLGSGLALICYSQANSFTDVVIAEIAFGVSLAFSQGADSALLRTYTQLLDGTGRLFQKQTALLATWQPIAQAIALIAGGLIGAINPRLAIAVSAAPYIIGCILSFMMKEVGERLVSQHRNPLRDMVRVIKESIGPNPHLRWLIVAYAIGREITHVMIWALTPLLLLAGVPLAIVGIAWVINSLMVSIGAWLAHRWAELLREWQRFIIPMIAVITGLTIMSIHLSAMTIWCYALVGLAQGWTGATLLPMVQSRAQENTQATIVSIARSASQLVYFPLVWIVSLAGNIDMRLTMIVTIVVFTPMILVVTQRLIALENK